MNTIFATVFLKCGVNPGYQHLRALQLLIDLQDDRAKKTALCFDTNAVQACQVLSLRVFQLGSGISGTGPNSRVGGVSKEMGGPGRIPLSQIIGREMVAPVALALVRLVDKSRTGNKRTMAGNATVPIKILILSSR
jgi:hypothetical protein